MSVSPLTERRLHRPLEGRLANQKTDMEVLFDLIGCLDGTPSEWAIPWFKAIGNFLARTGLSWRDIGLMLREASRQKT